MYKPQNHEIKNVAVKGNLIDSKAISYAEYDTHQHYTRKKTNTANVGQTEKHVDLQEICVSVFASTAKDGC